MGAGEVRLEGLESTQVLSLTLEKRGQKVLKSSFFQRVQPGHCWSRALWETGFGEVTSVGTSAGVCWVSPCTQAGLGDIACPLLPMAFPWQLWWEQWSRVFLHLGSAAQPDPAMGGLVAVIPN